MKMRNEEKARALTKTRLREARESAGLTQKELAERVGRHPSQITRWERSSLPQLPRAEVLSRIAAVTSRSVPWLLGLAD